MDFPFNIHAFFRTIRAQGENSFASEAKKNQVSAPMNPADEGRREGEIEREQESGFSCVL